MKKSVNSNILSEDDIRSARNMAVLSFIGAGDYLEAKALLTKGAEAPKLSAPIEELFNYAVADWGANNMASTPLFEAVAAKIESYSAATDANTHQCFALTFAVLGSTDQAFRELNIARKVLTSGEVAQREDEQHQRDGREVRQNRPG
ncbi:MAG: hypothetical protein KGQ26_10535 [Rhodospirillales bacterium]|nr:hypothetical protein [Rhodospirillales bacterium]MDE2319872.1 hypothetical protein [Rhodospirillales bacterium]